VFDVVEPLDVPPNPQAFIERVGWRFAATMPHIPHEYTVRGESTAGVPPPPVSWHDWFVDHVEEHGYRAKWGRFWNTYLELDGWKYWVIDPVINRERVEEECPPRSLR
jgi:hypothetical protein